MAFQLGVYQSLGGGEEEGIHLILERRKKGQ